MLGGLVRLSIEPFPTHLPWPHWSRRWCAPAEGRNRHDRFPWDRFRARQTEPPCESRYIRDSDFVWSSQHLDTYQNLEPIWLPHWPPWMWTISLRPRKGQIEKKNWTIVAECWKQDEYLPHCFVGVLIDEMSGEFVEASKTARGPAVQPTQYLLPLPCLQGGPAFTPGHPSEDCLFIDKSWLQLSFFWL